jgi:NAD(P)-dependent dehydrogenase (short-subunit alcohol dehydrogenase family)
MDIVIGAASGMGAAVARSFEKRGATLLLADRVRAADRIVECDITDQEDVDRLVGRTSELGALVIAAGLSPSMAPARAIYEVNLRGTARVLDAYEPLVREGSVGVCFASMAAHMSPIPQEVMSVLADPMSSAFFEDLRAAGVDLESADAAYAYSKAGVVQLARRAACRWGRSGGRVVSVSPGVIDTPMGRLESENQPMMAGLVASSAMGREGRADEVASVVSFLCSDAAGFISGADLLVDGGAVAAILGGM